MRSITVALLCHDLQMSRKSSQYHSILLYQLLGPGEWNVVAVNEMVAKGASAASRVGGLF